MTTRALRTTAQSLNCRCLASKRFYSRRIIRENDVVLLQRKDRTYTIPILTAPLIPNKKINIPKIREAIATEDIIGKGFRDLVSSTKGVQYRILQPSLGEYTDCSPRIVTPIYSQDASLIVSLLDLHPTTPEVNWTTDNTKLEIFEAGTGHGALTLHLSRAIHGANIRPPRRSDYNLDVSTTVTESNSSSVARKLEMVKQYAKARGRSPPEHMEESERVFNHCIADYIRAAGELGARIEFSLLAEEQKYPSWIRERFRNLADSEQDLPQPDMAVLERIYDREYDAWREGRRAVIHTLDNSERHSKQAERTVKNFKHGMYTHNIDFHVGSIEEYLNSRLKENGQEFFLDHAILDLPDTQSHMELVGKALKPNGSLVTWNPSISQVERCVEEVSEKKLPFLLEKVLEVVGGINGGREWDVRRARVRPVSKIPRLEENDESAEVIAETADILGKEELTDIKEYVLVDDSRYEMVCRPKVGNRIEGGGFISLWRRMEPHN